MVFAPFSAYARRRLRTNREDDLMERAAELARQYIGQPGVLGVYLVGSASRPFRDATSDYDIEVAVTDDVYDATPLADRHVFVIDEGPPRRVDHEFYLRPWSELVGLATSTRDLDHYPFRHAVVLHDPDGALAALFEALGTLPDDVRATRTRVHYLGFLYGAGRAQKCLARGDALNTRLVLDDAIASLVKLLFVLRGLWPAMRHWAKQELREAGVGNAIVDLAEQTLADPSIEGLRALVALANEEMDAAGVSIHRDATAMREWAFLTDEGKQAFREWR
jgi:hypothetical protein